MYSNQLKMECDTNAGKENEYVTISELDNIITKEITSLRNLVMENTRVMIMEEMKVLKEDVFREISNEFFIQDKIKEEIKMTVLLKVKSFEYEMTQKVAFFTDHLLGRGWDRLWRTPKDESLGSTFLKEILDRHISQCKLVLIRPSNTARAHSTLRRYPRRRVAKKESDVLDLIDDSNFMVKYINDEIGNGVFARRKFSKGEPLLEYKGKLREGPFLEDEDDTYFFEFNFNGKLKIIDASVDDGSLGRLINDEHCHPNIFPKLVEKGEKQHIIFKAKKDIDVEDEIRFDYGGESYSWRNKASSWTPSWFRNASS